MTLVLLSYRLVCEAVREFKQDLCFKAKAIETLQEVGEAYLVALFDNVNLYTIHTKHINITLKDIYLGRRIKDKRP